MLSIFQEKNFKKKWDTLDVIVAVALGLLCVISIAELGFVYGNFWV